MRCVNCESASEVTLVLSPEELRHSATHSTTTQRCPENLSRSCLRRFSLRVAAQSLHKRTTSDWALIFDPGFIPQNAGFNEWSRWDSNPRPPPCKGGAMVCQRFLELAEFPQTAVFLGCRLSQHFRRFAHVAARLLHRTMWYSTLAKSAFPRTRVDKSTKGPRMLPCPGPSCSTMLPVRRWRCIDQKAMALSEHRDGAHVHLQPVLLSHGADRFLVEWTLIGWRKQRS